MKVINYTSKIEWTNIIKSFKNWDVYFLNEYAISYMIHRDGKPLLLYFEDDFMRICYIVMKNDISHLKVFNNLLDNDKFYDFTSPYGYGGPLSDGEINDDSIKKFKNELYEYADKNNIVSQFLRYHPLLSNEEVFERFCENIYVNETIYIDTSSLVKIDENLESKNRNMIRKAIKNEVEIIFDCGENISKFKEIYEGTMKMLKAKEYYFFGYDYYNYILNNLKENIIFAYAKIDDKIIAGAIFFYNQRYMHYHLSGVLSKYRSLGAMNLLLYTVSKYAAEKNIEKLHLGGGVTFGDGLFKFKKQFNKTGRLPFYLGKSIFNNKKYEFLCKIRKDNDELFDTNNSLLIKYRME